MDKPFLEIDGANLYQAAFDTKPIEGYVIPTHKDTGTPLPYCCPFHQGLFEGAEKWFVKFPNCCDEHRALIGKSWFKKANYNDIATKIVKQHSYTEYHVIKQLNNPDWYKDITDYFEYNIWSFGQPTIGLHIYLSSLKHWINNPQGEPTEEEIDKLNKLSGFIDNFLSPDEKEVVTPATTSDLNVLYSTYQSWLKIFPFELSIFSIQKTYFENQLPFLNSKPVLNKYLGLAKAKLHTKSSLFESLINLTDTLLTQINGDTLLEKGLIKDADKMQIELIRQERKQKLKKGYKNSSPDEEHRYRKMIKDWLKDEQTFWTKMKPVLHKALPEPPMDVKDEISEFIELIASNARGKASSNIETLQNDAKFKISTQEQKLASYKMHLALFQKSCEQTLYPVTKEAELYNVIKNAIETKKVCKDKGRAWAECNTKSEVFNEIKIDLYKELTDYYTALELAEIIDAIVNGEEETSRLSNEEFIKGKFTISFNNDDVPTFTIKKRLEKRILSVESYLDANLKNWEEAIDRVKEQDKKLEVLHNALLSFFAFKYDYPHLEKQVNRVVTRLTEIETYLKFWQGKSKEKSIVTPIIATYTWAGNHNAPKVMYRLLKEQDCVPDTTDINNFLFVFTGKPANTSIEPIKWSRSNRLLAYFLFTLKKQGLISDADWQSKAGKGKFFTNANDKLITANDLAKAVSDCVGFAEKPDESEIVDTIISKLITK